MAAATDAARHRCLVRCLALARRLDGLRYAPPLAVLAREFGVSARTIRRDLMALSRAGWMVPKWRWRGLKLSA